MTLTAITQATMVPMGLIAYALYGSITGGTIAATIALGQILRNQYVLIATMRRNSSLGRPVTKQVPVETLQGIRRRGNVTDVKMTFPPGVMTSTSHYTILGYRLFRGTPITQREKEGIREANNATGQAIGGLAGLENGSERIAGQIGQRIPIPASQPANDGGRQMSDLELMMCFKEDTMVEMSDGSLIQVSDLAMGDEVKDRDGFTKVTNVTILDGSFAAHEFHLSNNSTLTATSPHYMIVQREEETKVVPASLVRTGDLMMSDDGYLLTVSAIRDLNLDQKVNVEVESALIYVNGILATGVCELGPEQEYDAGKFISEYNDKHAEVNALILASA